MLGSLLRQWTGPSLSEVVVLVADMALPSIVEVRMRYTSIERFTLVSHSHSLADTVASAAGTQ
jgi:hypothetical protein